MRRGRRHHRGVVGQELNVVPYLDIMVNLVLFMLVTITSFLSFTILNASIPQIAPDSAQVMEEQKKEELMLVVRVLKDHYRVDPSVQGGAPIAKRELPFKDGKYDVEALHQFMMELKSRFKDEDKVLIVAEPSVNYETIIQTMDSVRETAPSLEDLFPVVTLSIL